MAFILRFQEPCLSDSETPNSATKTATFVHAEQDDTDQSRKDQGTVPPPKKRRDLRTSMATQTVTRVVNEQSDSDRGNNSIPRQSVFGSGSTDTTKETIRMATQTVTEVRKEQRDSDPRNARYGAVPTSHQNGSELSPKGGDHLSILMATQTATKTQPEAADPDRSENSLRVIPIATNSNKPR